MTISAVDCQQPIHYAEQVLLYVNAEFCRRGNLRVELTSPSATLAAIFPGRPQDFNEQVLNWTAMAVTFWGEDPQGQWTIDFSKIGISFDCNGKSCSFKLMGMNILYNATQDI